MLPAEYDAFIASLGENIYTHDENTVFVQHYIHSKPPSRAGHVAEITQKPVSRAGQVVVSLVISQKNARVRIPGWFDAYRITVDNQEVTPPVRDGYATFRANPRP
jgi:DUF1680 family protein